MAKDKPTGIYFHISPELKAAIKTKAAEKGQTIKGFMLEAIRKAVKHC